RILRVSRLDLLERDPAVQLAVLGDVDLTEPSPAVGPEDLISLRRATTGASGSLVAGNNAVGLDNLHIPLELRLARGPRPLRRARDREEIRQAALDGADLELHLPRQGAVEQSAVLFAQCFPRHQDLTQRSLAIF